MSQTEALPITPREFALLIDAIEADQRAAVRTGEEAAEEIARLTELCMTATHLRTTPQPR